MIKISSNNVMSIYDSDIHHCYTDIWEAARKWESAHCWALILVLEETLANCVLVLDMALWSKMLPSRMIPHLAGFWAPWVSHAILSERTSSTSLCSIIITLWSRQRMMPIPATTSACVRHGHLAWTGPHVVPSVCMPPLNHQWSRPTRSAKTKVTPCGTLTPTSLLARNKLSWCSLRATLPFFLRENKALNNQEIQKVEVQSKGILNQLFGQGMPVVGWSKEVFALHLAAINTLKWQRSQKHATGSLTTKYTLWLDLRSTDDDQLNIYFYMLMDSQLIIETGWFACALYWSHLCNVPNDSHSAIICGQTKSGKSVFIID